MFKSLDSSHTVDAVWRKVEDIVFLKEELDRFYIAFETVPIA